VGKLPTQAFADFFDSTGKTWLLHLTGGKPFAYRGFVELCAALTRNHLLSLNSNVTAGRVRAFAQTVGPQRVEYIHCGVHPEEREKRQGNRHSRGDNSSPALRRTVSSPQERAVCRHRMIIDKHTVALISIAGSLLDVLGALYLAYDLLGGEHGPLRTLTRGVTYGAVFGAGYGLTLGPVFGLVAGAAHGITLAWEFSAPRGVDRDLDSGTTRR
jgi:hypothetical protein